MPRGIFVVFEGIDASGKSTQARRAAERYDADCTFEPGATDLGAELRQWLLNAERSMSPASEALLMLADRSHHVHDLIEPALGRGRSIISDRFYASTLAYQGYGRGLDVALLRTCSELAIGACRPDLTILIDVPATLANERRARDQNDRFEAADGDFHERVRQGYLNLASEEPARWVIIDGSLDEDQVTDAIDRHLVGLAWPSA